MVGVKHWEWGVLMGFMELCGQSNCLVSNDIICTFPTWLPYHYVPPYRISTNTGAMGRAQCAALYMASPHSTSDHCQH